ncbi:MAG: hypothetical protein NTY12_05580 [Candidatus Falkowbacteria bacterium]|nr:hypothetical protein [Candidatus Falkowbacteria bacterium]
MNKKILIIIGVVVVIGLAVYFTMGKKEQPNQGAINNRLADDSQMAPAKSLKDLLLAGKAMKCDYSDKGMTGTFYLADQKMRGNTKITADDKTIESHMIMVDKTSYTWTEGAKTGFKIVASEADVQNAKTTEQQESVSLDKAMNYKCGDWSKDNSYFELPAGVTFNDLSSMIPSSTPKIPSTTTDSSEKDNLKTAQCAACDNVPAASQAQCKAALGCK